MYYYSAGQLSTKQTAYSTAKVEFINDLFEGRKINDFDQETENLAMLRESDYFLYVSNANTYAELLIFVKEDILGSQGILPIQLEYPDSHIRPVVNKYVNNFVIFDHCNVRKLNSIELKFKLINYLLGRISITAFTDLEVIKILKAFNNFNDYVFKIVKGEDK